MNEEKYISQWVEISGTPVTNCSAEGVAVPLDQLMSKGQVAPFNEIIAICEYLTDDVYELLIENGLLGAIVDGYTFIQVILGFLVVTIRYI